MTATAPAEPDSSRQGILKRWGVDRAVAYAQKLANGAQAAVRWSKMAINKMIEQLLALL